MPHCTSNISTSATPRLGCEIDFRYEEQGRSLSSGVGSGQHAVPSLKSLNKSVVASMLGRTAMDCRAPFKDSDNLNSNSR